MADNNKTIITRIQNRRGLKQDLPKPLRPGELGFATDTRQVYIGADTSVLSDSFNKTSKFENVIGAKTITTDLVDDQLIQVKLPHRRYDRNYFDGTVSTVSWTPTSNAIATSSSDGFVFKSGETSFSDLQQGGAFGSAGVTVVKNGVVLVGDTLGGHGNISSGKDFFFSAGTSNTSVHQLSLRTRPVQSDEIGITYYSNADIWNAITASADVGEGGIGTTGVTGFHATLDSTRSTKLDYRYIDSKNIRVSASTGVGYIGLSPKHIIVASDVKVEPLAVVDYTNIEYGSLGNLLVSRNIQETTGLSMTATSSNVTVDVTSSNIGNYDGINWFTFSGNGWIDGKTIEIDSKSNTGVIVGSLPSNTALTFKNVTSIPESNKIQLDSVAGVTAGSDTVYLIDTADVANVNGVVANVVSISSTIVTLDTTLNTNGSDNALGNLYVIVRKGGVASNIVITSTGHGYEAGETFVTTNGDISGGSPVAVSSPTTNTFVVSTSTTITSNTTFTITPQVSNATVSVTPVYNVDVSSNTTLSQVVTHFNEAANPFEIRYVPDSANKIYLTEDESVTKSSTGFKIVDDTKQTSTRLRLLPGEYTKQNSTVKSKFETWLDSMYTNSNINMFKSIAINDPYSGVVFSPWNINIDSATDEVRFTSSEEARNFTTVLNNIYFDSENSDIKGLLNVKTNIEILTLESQESGDSDAIYTAPKGADIPSSTSTIITDLEANVDQYDAVFIEYSMQDKSANTSTNYKRVGTIHITGEAYSNTAIIQDNFTDSRSGYTGNVELTASFDPSGNVVQITANNTLSPGSDVRMTFIRRSWSTL